MNRRPSVIIAGAGIVGATLAYHLASAGASVTIIERSCPASGVTARSFAWINVVRGNAPAIVRLRNLAIADYRRLERELNGALAIDWNGALTWSGNPAESERLVAEHTARGHDVRLVGRDEIRRLEPRLAAPPPVAAHAAGEGALDPVAATRTLVRAAMEAGARLVEGSEVQGLVTTDGRVYGGTPTDRGMNSYTGLPRIRYRAMSSGATLIHMYRFLRLVAVGLPGEYRRFLSHLS